MESRKGFIGSADAPIIFKGTPLSLIRLWEEKTGLTQKGEILSNAMRHGNNTETEAREFFSEKQGDIFWPSRIFHSDHLWMRASLDGVNFDGDKAVEIKCPYSSDLLEKARNGIFNQDHIIQMQHQMFVADLKEMFYFIYKSPDENEVFTISRDEKIVSELVQKECEFWEKVRLKNPPVQEREDHAWQSLENAYAAICEKENEMKREKEIVFDKLKNLADGSSVVGKKIILTRYFRKGSIKYSNIPELKTVDLEKYRDKDIEIWSATTRRM